jgi:TyrR family helix-turn-helix protein
MSLKDALSQYESKIIKDALTTHISTRKAAAALGVSQATVWRKAKQYGIPLNDEN